MTHPHNPIEIYQSADGQTQVEVCFDTDTVWLSQAQMAQLFDTSIDNISLHLKNIYAEAELEEKTTTEDYSVVRAEGKCQVTRQIKHYNLDAVLSVGYRVKSKNATQFRRWATARLKDYLLKGYALNQQRLQQNAAELEQALRLIQKTAASPELTVASGRGLVDIVSRYTHTFLWLQQYDAGLLQEPSGENGGVLPNVQEARTALHTFKQQLIARGEATELFAREREDGFAALLGNLEQSIFGAPAIPLAKAKRRTCFIVVSNRTDTVLARLAVLSVLSSARRLVSALFETTIFFREESPLC